MNSPRAWSFLTIEGTRQYGGNTGYDDEPSNLYRYDSKVANHLQVAVGDVVVIRTLRKVIGIAEVERIETGQAAKDRFRCPVCGVTNIKQRAKLLPAWICKAGHTFETPVNDPLEVTTYAAHYGSSFARTGPDLDLAAIQAAVLRPSDQMSIKELDLAPLETLLGNQEAVTAMVRRFAGRLNCAPADSDADETSIIEGRRRIMKEIALRRGQSGFRKRLMRRYGSRCQISGCSLQDLVEAAHIRPYAACQDNGARNGILLRSDLHTLFDLGLLGVRPETLAIEIHPAVEAAGYAEFSDRILDINGTSGPDRIALQERWAFFQSRMD